MIVDNIRRQIDPDYTRSFARQREQAQKHGSDFWWAPGDSGPARGPQIGH